MDVCGFISENMDEKEDLGNCGAHMAVKTHTVYLEISGFSSHG